MSNYVRHFIGSGRYKTYLASPALRLGTLYLAEA